MRRENIWVTDSKGVVYRGRTESMDPQKERYAQDTRARTLAEIVPGADVFFGLSMAGVLKPEMVAQMAERPIILAMANPDPEIRPELAKEVRPDCIIATGRSDYPNQVNNVLCFPFIFRGALDVGATTINEEMKLACVRAIAELARADVSDVVAAAYGKQDIRFGPEYLIPPPFDPRLITTVAPAVAEAAMKSGVATRPLADIKAYRHSLERYVYTSGTVMQPVFQAASDQATKRIVYAEGEDDRVLRAAQVAVDEKLARPVLVGRSAVIADKAKNLGLRLEAGRDYEVVGFDDRDLLDHAAEAYYRLGRRRGVTRDYAAAEMRGNGTLLGAMLVREGRADGMLCGTAGPYASHLRYIAETIGVREGVRELAAMHLLMLPQQTVFICDTYINPDPSAAQLADIALLAAEEVRRFGLEPRLALLSHSSFGSADTPTAAQDARGPAADPGARARARGGGRDARRRRAVQARARPGLPRFAPDRRGQPAGDAQPGRRQHHLQRAEDRGRPGRHGRPDPARRRQAGPHPHPHQHRPPAGQHDGARGGRSSTQE